MPESEKLVIDFLNDCANFELSVIFLSLRLIFRRTWQEKIKNGLDLDSHCPLKLAASFFLLKLESFMAKSLVIVESPAKAKTINKYLGNGFVVKSSVGHIRDLPVSGASKVDPKARAKEAAKQERWPLKRKKPIKKRRQENN